MIKVLKIEGRKAYVSLGEGMEMWVDKAMLRAYGAKASDVKVGATFG